MIFYSILHPASGCSARFLHTFKWLRNFAFAFALHEKREMNAELRGNMQRPAHFGCKGRAQRLQTPAHRV
jgi:hypothetical protein